MKFRIQTKILIGYILIITAMAGVIIGVHVGSNARIAAARRMDDRYREAENLAAQLMIYTRIGESNIENFLVDGNRQKLIRLKQLQTESQKNLNRLLLLFPGDSQIKTAIQDSMESTVIYFYAVTKAAESGDIRQIREERAGYQKQLTRSLQSQLNVLNNLSAKHDKAAAAYMALSREAYLITLVLTLLLALAAIIVGLFIARGITFSLNTLMKSIKAVNKGQYQLAAKTNTYDEFEDMIDAFNQMVTTIKNHELSLEEKNTELQAQQESLAAQNEEILAQQDQIQQAFTDLSKHEELLGRLYRFSQSLTETIELNKLVQNALNGMMKEADAQVGSFLLYDEDSSELTSKMSIGLTDSGSVKFLLNEGLVGRTAAERKSLIARFNEGQLQSEGIRGKLTMASEIYLPLTSDNQLLGVIALGRSGKNDFSEEEQKRLISLADQIAVALHNSLAHLEIKQSLKRVQELDKLKSELINTVSHELRTPLASIYGFAELLLKKPPEATKAKKYLTTIYHESQRLGELINNFLDLQRIEAGRFEVTKQPVHLTELIQSNIQIYQGQSPIHTLAAKIEPNLPQVLTDPDRVSQVLGNLLSNALKYSPAGGLIEVRAFKRSAAEVAIAVYDHGLGIPKEALANIFHPFFRVDNSDRRQIGGTGLGLAICQRIMHTLGGTIEVQSEHGRGSIFTFTIPISGYTGS